MAKYEPGQRVSEYVLEQCVGAGSFGEVWQARHHIWKEHVAVKLPTAPEYVRYLQREGVVVHGLRHPNIIRVIGLDPFAEIPYLVMELVKGPSLAEVINDAARGGRGELVVIDQAALGLPLPMVTTVLRGVLRAMEVAHQANIVHRDLKPGNVLLNLDGRPPGQVQVDDVKVGDFGLGFADADTLKFVVEQSASIEREREGAVIAGTLAYMAPELRDGERPPSPRSDLYSIGVMLFEMLTGDRPAGAELPSTVRPEVPAHMDEIFRRLYARHDNRFESATAVLKVLDASMRPPAPPAASGGHGPRPVPPLPLHELVTCPDCRGPVQADDQFCTQCGRQLVRSVRRCGACGGYPGRHDRFCIFCGTALPGEE